MALRSLAAKTWTHPVTAGEVCFSAATIERWYYKSRQNDDPVRVLERRVRKDCGKVSLAPALSIYIRIRRRRNWQTQEEESQLAEYSLAFWGLSEGETRIASLRYDLDPGNATPNSPDWNDELQDNIAHPLFHLHVNYHISQRANDVRMALGQVSPILVLRQFPRLVCRGQIGRREQEASRHFGRGASWGSEVSLPYWQPWLVARLIARRAGPFSCTPQCL